MSRETWSNPDDSGQSPEEAFDHAKKRWKKRTNFTELERSPFSWSQVKDQIERLEREVFEFPYSEKSLEFFFFRSGERVYLVTPKEGIGLMGFVFIRIKVVTKQDGGKMTVAQIENFAVSPELQNQELGLFMIARLLKMLKEDGISQVYAPVRESNLPMLKLLKTAGFVATGMQDDFWDEEQRKLTDDETIWLGRLVPRKKKKY